MKQERPDCTIACLFTLDGTCSVAENLKFQAQKGSIDPNGGNVWDSERWNNLVERSKSIGESGECQNPDQINKALDEVNPIILETTGSD